MKSGSASSNPPVDHIALEVDPDEHDMPRIANVALVPAGVFDFDGTKFRWQMFRVVIEKFVELGLMERIVLVKAEAALRAYRNRQGSFDVFVTQQVRFYQDEMRLRGIRVSDVRFAAAEVIRERGNELHVFPRELAIAAKEVGMECAIISGSMIEVIEAYAKANGISIYLGTEHPQENGFFTGEKPREWCLEKENALRILAEKHHLDLQKSFAIGDTLGDVGLFNLVSRQLCFNPNDSLLELARVKGWTCIWEKKNVWIVTVPDRNGKLREIDDLTEILPEPLAIRLAHRLDVVRAR